MSSRVILVSVFFLATLSSCAKSMDEAARIAPYCKYKLVGGLHGWCLDPKLKASCECPPASDVKQPAQE